MKIKEHILTIILLLFVVAIFFMAIFGEEIDAAGNAVASFVHQVPKPFGNVICALAFVIVVVWCVVRSAREHWPNDTEFQNEDKLPHSED